jgi:hypothetical protein
MVNGEEMAMQTIDSTGDIIAKHSYKKESE